MSIADWFTNPANNTLVGAIDWSENMLPGQVNNSARVMMSDVATWRDFLTSGGGPFAKISGADFTGNISAPNSFFDTSRSGIARFGDDIFYSTLLSGIDPFINFDTNDYLLFSRSGNEFRFNLNGVTKLFVQNSGISVAGDLFTSGSATISGPLALAGISDFFINKLNPSAPSINWDVNDFHYFDRATNAYAWMIGNDFKMTLASNGTVTAGAFVPTSDRRIKSQIADLDGHDMLASLLAIGGKSYLKNGTPELGVIAQDVQAAGLGDLVHETNGVLGVNYNGLVAALISAVGYLNECVVALQEDRT